MKKLVEKSKDELLDEIRRASIDYIGEDKIIDEETESENNDTENLDNLNKPEDIEKAMNDFNKFSKLIKKLTKLEFQLKQYVEQNKDNEVLKSYLQLLDKMKCTQQNIDSAKSTLYESTSKVKDIDFENDIVKVTIVKPYNIVEFNKTKFLEDYKPTSRMYKKYMQENTRNGYIKYKVKSE